MARTAPTATSPAASGFSISLPRPLWIGLTTVVLVVLTIGLRFGAPIYRQQIAIREIERAGGTIRASPRGPVWLRQWVGEDRMKAFDVVDGIYLGNSRATDTTLSHMRAMTRLQSLSLANTRVTDAGLVHLKDLTSLQRLDLDRTQVTDAGFVHISGMTKLQVLQLSETRVTDAGLVDLKKLNRLNSLWLSGTQVTDAGLEHLHRMPTLRLLWLDRTMVTEAGVRDLKFALPYLRDVIDYEVKVLRQINRRVHIELTGPRVTDHNLCWICGAAGHVWGGQVEELTLTRTKVTDAGVAELERRLPGLMVNR